MIANALKELVSETKDANVYRQSMAASLKSIAENDARRTNLGAETVVLYTEPE